MNPSDDGRAQVSANPQNDLFGSATGAQPIELALPDASVCFFPSAFSAIEADSLFSEALQEIPWQQDVIRIAGKQIKIPRLQCLLGDSALPYAYSGLLLQPRPFPSCVKQMRERAQGLSQCRFNAALANLYRDERDSVDWHSDDESSLGKAPVIASVSFGETRRFELRHRFDRAQPTRKIELTHGSVLLMSGSTQYFWEHRLPKDSSTKLPRINLTFRLLIQPQ